MPYSQGPVSPVLRLFASPRLALGVIGGIVVYAIIGVGVPAAGFGRPLGEHPFLTVPFLALVSLLFLSTLACTLRRSGMVLGLWSGAVPGVGIELVAESSGELEFFLREAGFRGSGEMLWRNRTFLFSGWLLHVGLLVLMIGVGVQLAWHDGGAFEVAVGETVVLSRTNTVLGRSAGPAAPKQPPNLKLVLLEFDPHRHQAGFAPDRLSRIWVESEGIAGREVVLDRVQGATIGGTTIFQAMQSGIAPVVDLPGMGTRTIHLRMVSDRRAEADLTDPSGKQVTIVAEAQFGLDDRRGTGALEIRLIDGTSSVLLEEGGVFSFGDREAKLVDVVRWSGFTYSRSPGMPAVFFGFALLLIACTMLTVPAGVARVEVGSGGVVARVWLNRGMAVLLNDWENPLRHTIDSRGVGKTSVRDGQEAGR